MNRPRSGLRDQRAPRRIATYNVPTYQIYQFRCHKSKLMNKNILATLSNPKNNKFPYLLRTDPASDPLQHEADINLRQVENALKVFC
jgi:hypothetical protein